MHTRLISRLQVTNILYVSSLLILYLEIAAILMQVKTFLVNIIMAKNYKDEI